MLVPEPGDWGRREKASGLLREERAICGRIMRVRRSPAKNLGTFIGGIDQSLRNFADAY